MSKFESALNNIRIASPCSANWDEMFGNERMRFCRDCKLNVYNLSGLSREEAENLVMNVEGRLCVRFYRRTDGTVLTENCPVGWARVKQRANVVTTAAFSLILSFFGAIFFLSLFSKQGDTSEVGILARPTPTPSMQPTMGLMANTNTSARFSDEPIMGTVAPISPKYGMTKNR